MNGVQSFSKRFRRRIQDSVKRLFTTKSQETDEESVQKSSRFLQPSGVSSLPQKSFDSKQSTSSGDQYLKERSKVIERSDVSEQSTKYEVKRYTSRSGEKLIVPAIINHVTSRQSDDLKHFSSSKTTSETSPCESVKMKLVCPTGRHMDMKYEDPCICIHVEQLSYHQTQPIIYEWHKFKSEPTSLISLKLEYPVTCIQGGQGVVFWVFDMKNQRHFALKMKLRETKSRSSWLIEQRESKVLKEIQHNFIVNLFHVHESSAAMFMTMEYLDGGCLWSHIAKKGTLPESYTVYYTACILDALRYLHHNNIVYRDLKAENVVLDALGRPKLIDFGMAKKIGKSTKSSIYPDNDEETEKYPATQYYFAAYLAPEIYTKPSSANIFIDSWGIGYVVSELLLGYGVFVSMPWENSNDKNIKDNWSFRFDLGHPISDNCKDFLEKTLLFNPGSRISIDDAISHPFFQQVHWSTLIYIRPPNLSIFRSRIKGSKTFHAVLSSENQLSSLFEFCDLQLPDPILTPRSWNQCNLNAYEVATPKDTPINPNAPSIKLPIFVRKDNQNCQNYKIMRNSLKYDIYRALCINNNEAKKITIDTLSNLRPNRRF